MVTPSSTYAFSARHPARLLVVDDHPIVREGLVQLLSREPDLVVGAEAEDAEAAVELMRGQAFDLVIVDLSLPGISGMELIKRVHAEQGEVPFLVISMHDEHFYAERLLRAGARGYVMKHESMDTVVDAVRTVLRGDLFVSEAVTYKMLEKVAGGASPLASPMEQLTDRELEVFRLIGQGIATRDVAEMLHLSVKTIESHRANIKDKLRLKNATELVQHAAQWVQRDSSR